MATLEQLRREVSRIIQDSSFDNATIDEYLNRGMLEIAGGIRRQDSSVLSMPLPELYQIGTVATGTVCYASLPVDYQRDVVFATDKNGSELTIFDSFIEFAQTYPDLSQAGNITGLAVKGRNLYYMGIPATTENISVHYHRYPVDMVFGTDEPDGIPPELHSPLLVSFACKEIFSLIEDGMDGQMTNTQKYEVRFQAALDRLEATIPADAPPFYHMGQRR